MTLSSDMRASEVIAARLRASKYASAIKPTTLDGCPAYVLSNTHVSTTIVPSRGARIASLIDLVADYEWMWAPSDSRHLPECAPGDPFENGPITGADECIPTVGACAADGADYPDHGEAWARAWESKIDEDACTIETTVRLRSAPLTVRRSVSLDGRALVLEYSVTNESDRAVPWLWSWHPLFRLPEYAALSSSGISDAWRYDNGSGVPTDAMWRWPEPFPGARLDRADLGGPGSSAKMFGVRTSRDACMTLQDTDAGRSLRVALVGPALRGVGLWINTGGWNGYRHVAIEPTTAPVERPTDLDAGDERVTIAPRACQRFGMRVELGPIESE